MNPRSGLRKIIEETIGKQILENCQKIVIDVTTMMPPIPESKFIDKVPENVSLDSANAAEKEHQNGYVAEVIVYRSLELIKKNHLVIHQLEFTHEQYSAFVPNHQCKKTKKQKREREGECDFVVVGENFVAVLEVKGLSFDNAEDDNTKLKKFKGCCRSARTQRKRMNDLIKSIDSSVMIFEFTVFPNISMDELDQQYFDLCDESILFGDELEHLELITNYCETFSSRTPKQVMNKLCCSLLGLWCINQENRWELTDCCFSKCLTNIDQKVRRALVTRKAIDDLKRDEHQKRGKQKARGKVKKYPENPEMIDAPDLFKRFFNISCLTKEQLDLFNSNERFLWVEGPAGSGKTIACLGKIIDLAFNTPPVTRILLMLTGYFDSPSAEGYLKLLNGISPDITCKELMYDYNLPEAGDVDDCLDEAIKSLTKQLSGTNSKIILLKIRKERVFAKGLDSFIKRFEYVFVDDYQLLVDRINHDINLNLDFFGMDIISLGLLPVVKNSNSNKTRIWILCDESQSQISRLNTFYVCHHTITGTVPGIDPRKLLRTMIHNQCEFKGYFMYSKIEFSTNLRNAYEISTVLSIIREHNEKIDYAGAELVDWPQQKYGHFLRGAKPIIYLLRNHEPATWKGVLKAELDKLRHSEDSPFIETAILYSVSDEQTPNDIMEYMCNLRGDFSWTGVFNLGNSMSAEWPAVIFICVYDIHSDTVTLPDDIDREISISDIISLLYIGISRARVYSAVILLDYIPKLCPYTDKLFDELRQRRDICTIIDHETIDPGFDSPVKYVETPFGKMKCPCPGYD